jgi:hypothetical protein
MPVYLVPRYSKKDPFFKLDKLQTARKLPQIDLCVPPFDMLFMQRFDNKVYHALFRAVKTSPWMTWLQT